MSFVAGVLYFTKTQKVRDPDMFHLQIIRVAQYRKVLTIGHLLLSMHVKRDLALHELH